MDGGFRVRNRILDGHVYDLLVMNILKQLSTYRDNASFSLGNIGGGLALLAHIGIESSLEKTLLRSSEWKDFLSFKAHLEI